MSPAGRPRKGPRIHFQFESQEQHDAVKDAAEQAGVTLAEMLRRMIDAGLAAQRKDGR
jgi:hypothetical protein